MKHLSEIITPSQLGFVPKKALITNLLETLEILTDEVNKGKSVEPRYHYFFKAYDKVSHEKLLLKLEAFWIDSILLR